MAERTVSEARRIWTTAQTLQRAGLSLFPLRKWDATKEDPKTGVVKSMGKAPRDKGWQHEDYSSFDWPSWFTVGGNYGVRLRDLDLVVDIDPRNGGMESFKRLQEDLGIQMAGPHNPMVRTGSGGYHIFYRLPSYMSLKPDLKKEGYPGIDFKHVGGLVVAAGSKHPTTLKDYVLNDWWKRNDLTIPAPPEGLIDLLRKPPPRERTGEPGEFDTETLAQYLALLPAKDYRGYQEWLEIGMACHEATNGLGFSEWAEWSASDPEYAASEEVMEAKWDSFDAVRPGSVVTYKRIFKELVDHGHKDVVMRHGRGVAADDFPDDFEEPVEPTEARVLVRDDPDVMVMYDDPSEYEE